MEYIITLLILLFAVFIILKRIKTVDKCSKCVEKGSCYIGVRDCDVK